MILRGADAQIGRAHIAHALSMLQEGGGWLGLKGE
jgi:hypothetical protein